MSIPSASKPARAVDDSPEGLYNEFRDRVMQLSRSPESASAPSSCSVILTGSTGYLGTYLLNTLLADASISHIFCLNRRTDSFSDYLKRLRAGQKTADAQRVTFLVVDLAKPCFGLETTTYEKLRSQVTLIIHNAWPVNFKLPLSFFRPQFEGFINLFTLAASSTYKSKILFTSTVGAVVNYLTNIGSVSEEIITSFEAPLSAGYATSKFISELLLADAARHLGIDVVIARIGQAGGAIRSPGLWNTTEWLPRLVISSMHLKALPKDLGSSNRITWMPVDLLTDALVEVALQHDPRELTGSSQAGSIEVYHFINPNPTTWDALVPAMVSAFESHCNVSAELVSQEVWLDKVQVELEKSKSLDNTGSSRSNLELIPAIKLLDLYRASFARTNRSYHALALDKTLERSQALRSMPAVKPSWIEKWIIEWHQSLQRDPVLLKRPGVVKL